MKLQQLYDLQQEINRLFIAGSKFAEGDLRIRKYIPVFRKMGEKIPVFNRLATGMEDLIQTDVHQSAEKLTALSTLLYAVLYTQGDTVDSEAEQGIQQPFITMHDINTGFSYMQLHPVILALTTSNPGRLEVIQEAEKRGIFSDSRTFQYLDAALADKYVELADYIEKVIIPSVGTRMLPFLQRGFRYVDKTEHVRRLRLLDQLGDKQIEQIIKQIFVESLPSLQAEAVGILARDPANDDFIIKLAGDRNKAVREAAYKALAKSGTKKAFERLLDIYHSAKDKKQQLPAIVGALATTELPYFFSEIFGQVKEAFDDFIILDKSTDDKVLVAKLEKFATIVAVLRNKRDQKVDEFYAGLLSNQSFFELIKTKKNLLGDTVSDMMSNLSIAIIGKGNENAVQFFDKYMDRTIESQWNGFLWNRYLYAAEKINWPKEKIYDRFYPAFLKKHLSVNNLFTIFTDSQYVNYYTEYQQTTVYTERIDNRWIEMLYNIFSEKIKWDSYHQQALIILNAYEQNSARFKELLKSLLKNTQIHIKLQIFRLIINKDYTDKFDIILTALKQLPKNTNNTYWFNQLSGTGFWSQFPVKYANELRKLGETNKQDVFINAAGEIETGNK